MCLRYIFGNTSSKVIAHDDKYSSVSPTKDMAPFFRDAIPQYAAPRLREYSDKTGRTMLSMGRQLSFSYESLEWLTTLDEQGI